jgi:hypothetical protein
MAEISKKKRYVGGYFVQEGSNIHTKGVTVGNTGECTEGIKGLAI